MDEKIKPMSCASYRERIYPRYASAKMTGLLKKTREDYCRWAEACLWRIRGWLPEEKEAHCLDLACGPGNVLYMLREGGYRNLVGIDISPEQVEIARSIWAGVDVADAISYLRNHEQSFDLITAFDVIEHFHKEELFEVFDLLYKAIRSGGALIIQTPNADSPFGAGIRYGDFTHEVMFSPASLKHVLHVAGFVDFEARGSGPYVHGIKSAVRALLWSACCVFCQVWNLAETGSIGSGIYSRVFVAKVKKP